MGRVSFVKLGPAAAAAAEREASLDLAGAGGNWKHCSHAVNINTGSQFQGAHVENRILYIQFSFECETD